MIASFSFEQYDVISLISCILSLIIEATDLPFKHIKPILILKYHSIKTFCFLLSVGQSAMTSLMGDGYTLILARI